jgi:Uma2 family endonuclease
MATTLTRPMTFEEFEKLPNPKGARLELHHGEPVEVPPPVHKHYDRQQRIVSLIESAAAQAGEVGIEFAYRPVPDHECWVADVAFVSRDTYRRGQEIPLFFAPGDNIRVDAIFSWKPAVIDRCGMARDLLY